MHLEERDPQQEQKRSNILTELQILGLLIFEVGRRCGYFYDGEHNLPSEHLDSFGNNFQSQLLFAETNFSMLLLSLRTEIYCLKRLLIGSEETQCLFTIS